MKFFTVEYNTGLSEKPVEISLSKFVDMTITFDREQFEQKVEHNKEYYVLNNNQVMIDFHNEHKIHHIIHQDSDRDLYITD